MSGCTTDCTDDYATSCVSVSDELLAGYASTVVPRKTNASWDEKLARQMFLVMGLMTRKTNVPMAMLRKKNLFRFLFLPHVC